VRVGLAELWPGRFSMNTTPLLRESAVAERKARAKLVETFAFALALGCSAGGLPAIGLMIGSLTLGYGVKREGTTEQWFKAYAWRIGLLFVSVMAVYIARGVLVHWADFKQGFLDGWTSF